MGKEIEITKTERGFPYAEFTDRYGVQCSIQKSSLAFEDCIWLGVNDPNLQVMWNDAIALGLRVEYLADFTGWVDYPLPKQVVCSTRMHLTRDQVKALMPLLQRFVETGEIQEVENG